MIELTEVIEICNNLFYSNYYNTGGQLKSREELENDIKRKISSSLIEFFGYENSELINGRVNKIDIEFNYKTLGKRNSILQFLKDKREEYVINKTGVNLDLGFGKAALQVVDTFKGDYKKLKGKNLWIMEDCLEVFGYDPAILYEKNSQSMAQFVEKLRSFCRVVDEHRYSDIPEVNDNMLKLREYVAAYKNESEEKKYSETEMIENDEVAKYTTQNSNFKLLRENSLTTACYYSDKIRFGVCPKDSVIIHEFLHGVTECGFANHNWNRSDGIYSKEFCHNEMFDEVVTEYLAQRIFKDRQRMGKEPIVNDKNGNSAYRILFPYMSEFIEEHLSEIAGSALGSDPYRELQTAAGSVNMQQIVTICNEIFALTEKKSYKDNSEKIDYEKIIKEYEDMLKDAQKRASVCIDEFRSTLIEYSKYSHEQLENYKKEKGAAACELMDIMKNSPKAMKRTHQGVSVNRQFAAKMTQQQQQDQMVSKDPETNLTQNKKKEIKTI